MTLPQAQALCPGYHFQVWILLLQPVTAGLAQRSLAALSAPLPSMPAFSSARRQGKERLALQGS